MGSRGGVWCELVRGEESVGWCEEVREKEKTRIAGTRVVGGWVSWARSSLCFACR